MRHLLWILLITLSFSVAAQQDSTGKWWVPDHVKMQFAGNIGFLSVGAGYKYGSEKWESDLYYGYVPGRFGGPLHSVTIKTTWFPFRPWEREGWKVDWISFGIPLNYTFGDEYFLFPPDKYPKGYYDHSTALRAGIFMGGRMSRLPGNQKVKGLGLYYEAGTYDLLLHNYIFNTGTLKFHEIFNLGLGLQVSF